MQTTSYGIDITPLLRSSAVFERFRQNLTSEQDKAGAVQAFEMTYELSWKMMKRILGKKGIEVNSPRDAIREAAKNKLISDPKLWFNFVEKRNLTTHTYDEVKLQNVINIFDNFSKAVSELIHNIQNVK